MFRILIFVTFLSPILCQKTCIKKFYRGADNPMNCACNSTYCDECPPLGSLATNQAAVYTSSQSGKRFERTTETFSSGTAQNTIKIFANTSQQFQKIIGFGGAFTDAAGINMAKLSQGAVKNLLGAYYGPEGIGYTTGRVPMASCDFSTHPYSYDDVPGDFDLTNFALVMNDFDYKIPFIKLARELSQNKLKLFASPWSAPAWMKQTGIMKGGGPLVDGGDVTGTYYKTWANYFVRFFEEYAKNNVTFWGVTMENEPEMGANIHYGFQAMYFNETMERDFAKGYWGQALRSNPITKDLNLMILDGERNDIVKYSDAIFGDPESEKIIDGVAVHWYWDGSHGWDVLSKSHAKYPNKWILYTEACHVGLPKFGAWSQGDSYAHSITQVLQNWVGGWTDWNLCLDPQGGPNWVNNFVDAPIIVSNTSDEFEKQPMYYALGHFSKFLVPDSTMVSLNVENANGTNLEGVAGVTPDAKKVIVLNNRDIVTTYQVSILNDMGAVINLNLEPKSYTTIVYN